MVRTLSIVVGNCEVRVGAGAIVPQSCSKVKEKIPINPGPRSGDQAIGRKNLKLNIEFILLNTGGYRRAAGSRTCEMAA